MTHDAGSEHKYSQIDRALESWQQGDCVLGGVGFVYQILSETPVTAPASGLAGSQSEIIAANTQGIVLISQTCDIRRRTQLRPYVEAAVLVAAPTDDFLDEVRKSLRPQFAYIPSVANRGLVADLDQVMTLEKPLLVSHACTRGCRDVDELRVFGRSIARKFSRFAFPDDFNAAVKKLVDTIKSKHPSLPSEEGAALRALREIRVAAIPNWQADPIDLFFYFVLENSAQDGRRSSQWLSDWCAKVKIAGRFRSVDGVTASVTDSR